MGKEFYLFIFGIAVCKCEDLFDRIGDGHYFIGNEKTAGHYFDWFVARRDCWDRISTLLSVENAEELGNLQQYILSRGFPDGSTFATSGSSFKGKTHYSWEAVDEPLTFAHWLPGSEAEIDGTGTGTGTFLSLQLANSSLYMRPSYGQDDYYICEYKFSLRQLALSLETQAWSCLFVLGVLLWLCYFACLLRWKAKKETIQHSEDKMNLIA
ncbi:uncharacterized protein LOC108033328 [Drosophila biarmipes]|uniref:uncharacterized protein LOC108033328 n=1 Tax=Drosophila biarmipes TaxID=125945 RepID=UPI0007E63652|nr:uncharacterized protein LOC108033328 [Drosophila biarmipes]